MPDPSIHVRAADMADLDALTALDHRCFDEAQRWSADAWQAELIGDGLVLVALAGSRIVSAASFHVAGDSSDLFSVMTAPDWRGLGLATKLLAQGFEWAASLGATEMVLEVRLGNGAQALYADLGFTPLYERTNYYGPGLHALVMRRDLKGNFNGQA